MAEWLPFCAVLSEALVQTRLAEALRVVLRALEGHVRRRAADLVADALRGPGPNQPNDQPTNPALGMLMARTPGTETASLGR